MRILDIISEEEGMAAGYAEQVQIDWNAFKAALTVIATEPELKGVKPVDAIMFLGLIGDPNPRESDAFFLKKPARFAVLNDKGMDAVGFHNIQGEWSGLASRNGVSFDVDFILNPKFWDKAMSPRGDTPELVAHEARHRGLYIVWASPNIKVPQHLQDLNNKYHSEYRRPGEPEGIADSFDHMMMYSLELGGSRSIGPAEERYYYRSKQEMLQFRRWYYELEALAKRYLATIKVPPGGYEALRKAMDDRTPDDLKVDLKSGPDGKPVVVATPKQPKQPTQSPNKRAQSPQPVPGEGEVVIVKKGDNLTKIANRMGVGLQDLIKANPQIKNPNLIYPGDEISIP